MNRPRFFYPTGFLLLAVAIVIIAATYKHHHRISPGSIPVKGGEKILFLPDTNQTHFSQGDPRWADQLIGGSSESIQSVGCTLCCVAMAFDAIGIRMDPSQLNLALIEANGYTEDGWIKWSAVESVSGDKVAVVVHEAPDHSLIDNNLKAGRHTLAKFFLPFGIPHWVLVCGKQGDDYLILDPALRTGSPVLFSTRATSIVSLRTIALRQ